MQVPKELITEKLKKFIEVINTLAVGIAVVDSKRRVVAANRAGCAFLGYPLEELTGAHFTQFVHPEDLKKDAVLFQELLDGDRTSYVIDKRYIRKDGSIVWGRLNVSLFADKTSQPRYTVMSCEDITDYKSTEEGLRKSQIHLQAILDNTNLPIFLKDNEGGYLLVNRQYEKLARVTNEEIRGKNDYDIFPKPVATLFRSQDEEVRKKEELVEFTETISLPDGIHTFITAKFPIRDESGNIYAIGGVCTDITELKRSEEALSESEEKFQTIFEQSPLAIMYTDEHGIITTCNAKASTMFGAPKEKLIGFSCENIQHQEMRVALERALTGEKSSFEGDYLTVTGNIRTQMRANFSPTFHGDGSITGVIGIFEDISERLQTEEKLRELENRYRAAFQTSPDSISISSMDGMFVEINEGFIKLTGYTREDVIGRSSRDINLWDIPEDRDRLVAGLKEKGVVDNLESRFRMKDGSTKIALMSATIITLAGEPHIISIGRDITDKRQMELELQKVQKLESVGILAGGIAHDFNNLLTAIFGNISLAKMNARGDATLLDYLTRAEKASHRAQDLTRQLLTFSKGGAPIRKAASIKELVVDSASFTLSGSNVRNDLVLDDDLWPVMIDEGQISQVIQNIVKNADQAMPDGGVITISAINTILENESSRPLPKGKYVKISIADQGVGIMEKHLAKVFDPYFSTKQNGSGLGLAVSFSIIQKHDGLLQVSSAPGSGATFTLFLPATDELPVKRIKAQNEPFACSGRILLMDDQEAVLTVVGAMLTQMGYDVETVVNGEEAIGAFTSAREDNNPFTTVILDLTIPGGMGGMETLTRMLKIDPDTRAIVSSGYADDPIMAHYEDYGFKGVVSKPFSAAELIRELRRVFDKQPKNNN